MPTATGWFDVASWDEDGAEATGDGARLTDARVAQRFNGDLAGTGTARWLMCYRPDGTARFVGLQKVDGELAGRTGSFVLETVGEFDGDAAAWEATVVPGSTTGGLDGLRGRGVFRAPHGGRAEFTIDFALDG